MVVAKKDFSTYVNAYFYYKYRAMEGTGEEKHSSQKKRFTVVFQFLNSVFCGLAVVDFFYVLLFMIIDTFLKKNAAVRDPIRSQDPSCRHESASLRKK